MDRRSPMYLPQPSRKEGRQAKAGSGVFLVFRFEVLEFKLRIRKDHSPPRGVVKFANDVTWWLS